MEQEVGRRIVRDIDVDGSVVVVVGEDDTQAFTFCCIDASFATDVCKRAVAVIAVENVSQPVVDVRMAVEPDVLNVSAILIVVDLKVHVVGHVQVHVAVVVDVPKGTTRTPRLGTHPSLLGDIQKTYTSCVLVQRVRADTGDVYIFPSIVVVVGRAGAHSEARSTDPGSIRHVSEPDPSNLETVVAVEPVSCRLCHTLVDERSAIHEKDVRPTVVVVVENQCARTHRFRHEFVRTRTIFMREVDP